MAAGVKRQRAPTLIEFLHHKRAISYEQFAAADLLREQIMKEMPPSQGVSSYGSNVKASEPSRKADRVGRRLSGYEIQPDGEILYGGRRSRSNERRLEDAIYAAVGLHTDDGRRVVNISHAELLIRIVTHSENMPTLTEIAKMLGDYYSGAKQMPPFAMGWLQTILGRLARHYQLVR